MPRILVFGDSNSWGYDPLSGRRFDRGIRWPTVMQAALGHDWELIEEALNGRTTVFEDPIEPHRSGIAYWPACLLSHAPLDVIIIALGVNDLKRRFSLSAADIAAGAGRLIKVARDMALSVDGRTPVILLVVPPPLAKLSGFADMFAGGTETSRHLKTEYEKVATELRVPCVAMGDSISLSDLDGIHLDAEGHKAWGLEMARRVAALSLATVP